ncbi:right-handed parallel beta-helix repeat-containing protein [Microvirga rosea]|uniref:right-handed parallel beta-helix repeat-containing protein n=1 Tax=Microvirga rosea TaxID=2715425 RepID=UPI001D0B42B8|nr:right-handed parallel beta-helix repeat-containing protein [Microvirga rosea]MCB8818937.1 right-handed parallel beta-helix repeat-containing protein [Microvirga rosea]
MPSGVTLTPSGDIIVTKAGTVLSNLDVRGQIWVRAENVTIQNCKITSDNYYGVRIDHGLKGVTVKNCEIDGQGQVLNGIGGAGTFVGNNIYGCENGINIEGNVATKIEGNYIHNFLNNEGGHFDGIQIFGDNANVEVVHNTIINDGSPNGVSAIFVANTFGAVSNVNIHDNYFSGGGFPLYFDGTKSSAAITGVSWHDNYVVKGGYGYEYIRADSQGHKPASSNNIMVANGVPPAQAPDKYSGGTPISAPAKKASRPPAITD